jgi:hypothetical protein
MHPDFNSLTYWRGLGNFFAQSGFSSSATPATWGASRDKYRWQWGEYSRPAAGACGWEFLC